MSGLSGGCGTRAWSRYGLSRTRARSRFEARRRGLAWWLDGLVLRLEVLDCRWAWACSCGWLWRVHPRAHTHTTHTGRGGLGPRHQRCGWSASGKRGCRMGTRNSWSSPIVMSCRLPRCTQNWARAVREDTRFLTHSRLSEGGVSPFLVLVLRVTSIYTARSQLTILLIRGDVSRLPLQDTRV